MRHAAEWALGQFDGFTGVNGLAEATTLPSESVALVTSAQAFHWFDTAAARREFRRRGHPSASIELVWNDRHEKASAFDTNYKAMLQKYCAGYGESSHRHYNQAVLEQQFGVPVGLTQYAYTQRLTWEGLVRRLHSASYVPKAGPIAREILRRASELFDTYQDDGNVTLR